MKTQDLQTLLRENPYPGRGILLGRSAGGDKSVLAYFIMGRSENSRNRVFVRTEDGIRTQAHDPSKMTDPTLIIYHPVRILADSVVVTNGDQTDTVRDALAAGRSFRDALETRAFEPDEPNYTPRISGLLETDGRYRLSILKSAGGDPACCCRYYFEYGTPLPGVGHLIHTYQGDGSPLPSFEGEPVPVSLTASDARSMADRLWSSLNAENKVALFVRYADLATGAADDVIINRLN